MNKYILILSRCLKKQNDFVTFHFKGFYRGEKIAVIHLYSKQLEAYSLKKDDECLIWVKERKVVNNILEVDLIKIKKI